ncbi:JmjC domain-containing protein [Glaciecola sp.]|jgi:50S ribosomal protein L16 3-hydroxylase|uniref:JmjC domain-containing protein n=1 Tax=Glaciecola sp. MF2-115 TaxID=3384827 RepID=UPI003988B177
MIITEFDQSLFLAEYWQKKPCVIRGFIKSFVDPIDEHELAGLAQEPDIDSRIVSYSNQQWIATQGPIEDFEELCVGAWSLLVQGVDRYIDEVDELTDLVNFIPNWRLDDVMISFSNEGAGVGPHTDQYDVFIIQGKGKRRWQVGLPGDYAESIPHPLLRQIDGFEAVIDEVLLPGDVVYIPPKHPHNGVALSDCLNYSIGFRAPTSLEMLSGLIDENRIEPAESLRYTDPDISRLRNTKDKNTNNSSAVSSNEIQKIKQLLQAFLDSESADNALLQFLSRQSLPSDEALNADYDSDEIKAALLEGATLARMTGVKPVYAQEQSNEQFIFYIDGNEFKASKTLRAVLELMLNVKEVRIGEGSDTSVDVSVLEQPDFIALVMQLVNLGYWVLLD